MQLILLILWIGGFGGLYWLFFRRPFSHSDSSWDNMGQRTYKFMAVAILHTIVIALLAMAVIND